jgi:arginase family enzyme
MADSGVAERRRIAGVAIVEFVPARDPHGAAATTAARLTLSLIGLIAAQAARPPR